ncbi:hypothetical protein FPL06_03430 [Xanthomonas citri pv. glycines]|nr:hypothetical protein BHE84_24845 [Xanthomonas citri pv. glycines str. 8ra]QDR47131.1 hypothetical protein FPK90_22845 [Xanthomonas citri pv. glycines]QDS09115.1 hypothetical protein FPL00_21660 [Xanthomonas citri pv. glycines]QDS13517.1 hypothetical protein FPL03_22370 [Xanthomonas citri pv. glycines]QDS22160.1 hypothetical protein FPL05_22740 [Xanthomonas citri pv. glycines]
MVDPAQARPFVAVRCGDAGAVSSATMGARRVPRAMQAPYSRPGLEDRRATAHASSQFLMRNWRARGISLQGS